MRTARIAAGLAGVLALTGCGALGGDPSEGNEADDGRVEVVLATHESFALPEGMLEKFEEQKGIDVTVQAHGDAGQLTNKLVLSKDSPIADAVYGIDNTFASRALDNDVFAGLGAAEDDVVADYALPGGEQLLPVDYGDVCVNIDDTWFARKKVPAPTSLDDLVEPAYKDLFVTPGANTSSPGMAFLLATIAKYGDRWPSYWEELMANGAKVTSGWTDAYTVDFTAGGGANGTRPIVLSYSSSPPFTIPEGGDRPTTSALLDTCFRQVEYAGVLAGAQEPEAAAELLEFLVSDEVQAALPDSMYVYPVSKDVQVPEAWATWAPVAPEPFDVAPGTIAEKRSAWLEQWRDIVTK